MTPWKTRLFGFVIVAALVGAPLGCSHGKAANTKDSGTSDKDLAPAPDEAAGKDPFHADAGADTGEDAALLDLPAANRDVGREGRVSPRDAASGNRDQGAGVDGGEPSTCTGILSLGDYLMSSSPRMNSPLTMADLNGDGLVDLVSPGRVAFGKGNGTFSAPVDFKIGSLSGMAVGDLDGDGKVDMVTVGNGVGVLRGMDDGTFVADAVYTCGKGAGSVALADLNGDGKLDAVTANHDANTVSVLLGMGDGTFAATTDYPTGNGPSTVLVGDVNGDGKLDVMTVNLGTDNWSAPTVSTLLGVGNGKLAGLVDTQGGADPGKSATAVLGDLNGDGKLDLVVTSPGTTKVLLGMGDGRFAAPVSGTWGDGQRWVTVSDLNGDGKLDVVVLMSGMVRVLPGRGDGTFSAALDSPTSKDAQSAVLGDVNGDGKADIVVSMSNSGASGALGVLLGTGRGTFGMAPAYPTGSAPSAMALGDVNDDGKMDVVTASQSSGTVSVLVGNGTGAFAANVDYTVGKQPFALALGDLNGDGTLDIVTVNLALDNTSIDTVSVLLGKGAGAFATKRDFVTAPRPNSLVLGDVNDDGKLDIVTTNGGSYEKGTVNVLFGKGDGTFTSTTSFEAGYGTQGVALGDLNGDGVVDMVVANAGVEYNGSVTVMVGKGDGTFPSSTAYRTGNGASYVALGDLDRDGVLDIVMSSGDAGNTSVLFGNGDGTFTDDTGYTPSGARPRVLGDLNGDGWLDVIAAGGNPGLTVLLGQGDGTFSPSLRIAFDAADLALADLNGDGRPDIVALTESGITVLLTSCR